jgi:hypothetical protein
MMDPRLVCCGCTGAPLQCSKQGAGHVLAADFDGFLRQQLELKAYLEADSALVSGRAPKLRIF